MRQKTMLAPTLREAPSDAEAISHQLLLRGGFIRQLAAGIYTYLPLGLRVLRKVEAIVREEMDRTGAQELLMPAMQNAELWQESGRYEVYGPELIRLKDRHQREFVLGPTHEEVITTLVRDEVTSYRKLPMTLYQIQTKFRDERRPRYGLLRGREFLMKDAYSFDVSWEGLAQSYEGAYGAYSRIFERCGLRFRAVEADAGSIGGEGGTHEFMALADIGEDTIVSCKSCEYAANLEKAESAPIEASMKSRVGSLASEGNVKSEAAMSRLHTPGAKSIGELVSLLGVGADGFVKTLIYNVDGAAVAVLVRGDHEVNEIKLAGLLGAANVELADAGMTEAATGAPVGFAGPVGLSGGVRIVIDRDAASMASCIAGANEVDYHVQDVVYGHDFTANIVGDVRNVAEGDRCVRCGGELAWDKGIEVGHVFKLGTKYSDKLGAKYLDAGGVQRPMIMGCYGIGVSRVLSAVAEQHYDEGGIRWPMAIAPYQVHILVVNGKNEEQVEVAEQLYAELLAAGVEVLLDDRDERVGVKFKDADLIGIPLRVTVGKQAAEGKVELKERGAAEVVVMSLEDAIAITSKWKVD
ncbi:proline--tRNA ligase [Paenibacillus sp. GCM10023252]|uniref:proline--tRNA ligase n=1 Tax=Paenibacillus sp. GCM10023252 TaxID=3252649 RepID=UPI0036184004